MNQDSPKDIICHCSGTSAAQIKKQIEQGADDLDSLSRATGACSGCGSCEDAIVALIGALARHKTVQAL